MMNVKSSQTDSSGQLAYVDLLDRLRKVVSHTLPPDATVIVVSRGDEEVLRLEERQAWHFPQREDGVYAGYYPPDSQAAVAHLETLRARGGQFLIFPQTAFWWLDHYPEFRQHLESNYQPIAREEDTCLIFSLLEGKIEQSQVTQSPAGLNSSDSLHTASEPDRPNEQSVHQLSGNGFEVPEKNLSDYVNESLIDRLRLVFDRDYYNAQAGTEFVSSDAALIDYLERGSGEGYNPHPLFDTAYYLNQYPQAGLLGANPLIHFLSHSVSNGQNPCPYFDTEYYYSQDKRLRENGINPLVHYLSYASADKAYRPNPLFANGYYLSNYNDVKHSGMNPLAHYLSTGCQQGRFASHTHRSMSQQLLRFAKTSLLRGNWKSGTALLLSYGDTALGAPAILRTAEVLAAEYRLNCLVVLFKRQEMVGEIEPFARVMVLEDFQIACDIFRPSALCLLTKWLCSMKPLFAICEAQEMLETMRANGVPSLYFCPDSVDSYPKTVLKQAFQQAGRVILNSSNSFHSIAEKLGSCPTNVAVRPLEITAPTTLDIRNGRKHTGNLSIRTFAGSLLQLAQRDFGIQEGAVYQGDGSAPEAHKKIIIPCSDWSVSGVNSSLEALGKELIRLGWDVQIVFTRAPAAVMTSAGCQTRMPQLPYSFLETERPGIEGMWESLIPHLETRAPCIMFMAYDFAANSIAPALSDRVGVVSWVQADDGDYYEQTYRLGRYCNAVVCVSERLKHGVNELNPLIGEKAQVIYNSSIREREIASKRPAPAKKIRLIYTGRLVQYQKRVIDFIKLAHSLDAIGTPYQLTLVGEFLPREDTREIFESLGHAHLADGRIVLTGRMAREQILEELSQNDIFLLLSDFEGLPLALVEAMARGCVPVVAAIESGMTEIIDNGKNGVIVSGRDYDEWATLLNDLWSDRKRLTRMSKQARKTVQERFTVEHVAQQFHELFNNIAEEVGSQRYSRPPCLNWGPERSATGDVLPPPTMFRPPVVGSPGSPDSR